MFTIHEVLGAGKLGLGKARVLRVGENIPKEIYLNRLCGKMFPLGEQNTAYELDNL